MDRRKFDIADNHDIIAILDADQAIIKCSNMKQGIAPADAEDDDAHDLSKARRCSSPLRKPCRTMNGMPPPVLSLTPRLRLCL